jgi:uncharacterized protein (TIGR00730 family)
MAPRNRFPAFALPQPALTLPRGECHIRIMSILQTICVYCGSGPGKNPAFVKAARKFGKILAENDIGLIYGGGSIGLMGELAKSVLKHGGKVTGVIPEFLIERERMLEQAQDIIVTKDMHERKQIMFERSDAFVALPGGVGTLEETVEQLTWSQLGRHKKPILAANIEHFWDPLCVLLDHMERLEFIRPGLTVKLLVANSVDEILPRLRAALAPVPPEEKKMKTVAPERM